MPPSIPRELVKARLQRDAAWEWYGQAVDEGQPHDITEMLYIMADCWDIICQNYYDRWQWLGGASDIVSIVEAEQTEDGAVYMQNEPAWMIEAKAEHQDFMDVKFGSRQWWNEQEEIPF